MKDVLIDCDPGIDDALAIIFALLSNELEVKVITTVSGNKPVKITTQNALTLVDFEGRSDIPVARGMETPMERDLPGDPFSHGENGLGNIDLPEPDLSVCDESGPDKIIEAAKQGSSEFTLIATGPLTNVAVALQKEPSITEDIDEMIFLGGAYGFTEYAYKNATGKNPVSEWNVYVDPEAARLVFQSDLDVTAIGLDVATHPKNDLDESAFQRLKNSSANEADFVLQILEFVSNRGFDPYCALLDPLAVGLAIDDSLAQKEEIKVDVETEGNLTLGQTVVERRRNFSWKDVPRVKAITELNYESFLNLFLTTIL